MEKIGLFDLIDKFTTPERTGKSFRAEPKARPETAQQKSNETLKDPDFGAQPQYLMNAKMQAFLKRHENLKAEIPAGQKEKRQVKQSKPSAQRNPATQSKPSAAKEKTK